MTINDLLINKDLLVFDEAKTSFKNLLLIKDSHYWDFINTQSNGGFFFGQSLLIYPFLENNEYPSANLVNSVLSDSFGVIVKDLFSFAQDIFGNQFCFDFSKGIIVLLDIENGGRKIIANDFINWITVLLTDYDLYTGYSYWQDWTESYALEMNQRLCAKVPFTIGGDYKNDNLYASSFPAYIELNADLAKQIYDLPDGTTVTYEIK